MQTVLAESRPPELLPLVASNFPKRPGLAFGLSLVFPGLGHLYLGRPKTTFWIVFGELLSLGFAFSAAPALIGNGLLGLPAIYIFAAADAFWGTREWNADAAGRLVGTNPRIATILNLLTKGFGYFYLGQRTKGITVFILMSIAQAALGIGHSLWIRLAAISLQLFAAADGYRVARQHLLAANPELAPIPTLQHLNQEESVDISPRPHTSVSQEATDPLAIFNTGTFSPVLATGLLVLLSTAAVSGYITFAAGNGRNNHGHATIESGPAGLVYRNATLGLQITAPQDWSASDTSAALTRLQSNSCVVVISDNTVFLSSAPLINATQASVLRRYPNAATGLSADWHGKEPATGFTINRIDGNGRVMQENAFFLRHGFHLTSLFEVYPTENATCPPDLAAIERSLTLAK